MQRVDREHRLRDVEARLLLCEYVAAHEERHEVATRHIPAQWVRRYADGHVGVVMAVEVVAVLVVVVGWQWWQDLARGMWVASREARTP